MTRSTLPLLLARDPTDILAWRAGRPIRVACYLADVTACAATLPASGPVINLCGDRYAFAVALGAALLRGQTSLLPPDARPETLLQLLHHDQWAYGLTDDGALQTPGVPLHRWPLRYPPQPGVPGACEERGAGGAGVAGGAHSAGPPWPRVAADALATSLLTSGSTGQPQPHGKSWRQWTVNVEAAAQRLAQHLGRPGLTGLTLVATVPPQHSYGFESSVLLALLGGAAFEAGRPFYPADIVAALDSVPRPRALVSTPFHLKSLLQSGLALPATDLVLSATAPLSPQLARQAEARLGGPLIEIYGCTEAGQVASRRTAVASLWHTFGSLRIHACPAPSGEADSDRQDSFTVQGGHLAEPTALSDRLALTDASHFQLLGRANDLIQVAGKRSSLGLLNHHLNRIEGVDDGAFWLPDEVADGVVRPVALVVSATLSPAQVIAALRRVLEPVFVPRRVLMVAALPRQATGKITAQALGQFALAVLAEQAVPAPLAGLPAPSRTPCLSGAGAAVVRHIHIATDHPAFAGHFPGQPILPGVSLLALVLEAWQAALDDQPGCLPPLSPNGETLNAAKFLAPVAPGADLRIELQAVAAQMRFEVTCAAVRVSSGSFATRPAATA